MSLMSTLAKVAIGVAMAKGASAMMNKSGSPSASPSGNDGLGGLMGSMTGGSGGSAGGLEDMLGGLLGGGGGVTQAGGMPGGLGGLLEQIGGGTGGGQGGLQDILGGLAGAGGLLGGLASALGGGAAAPQNDASFGSVLNSSFDQTPEAKIEPTADQEAAAGLMLRAMIQAAKSDGKLDDAEREKLVGQLGDEVSSEEASFVQAELQGPVDIDGLVSQTPNGMQAQMYAMSVLGINLDSRVEAEYLHKLASAYGMKAEQVNDIHAQMGVPSLYT
jgi:uncharacterized membrane protein YebE (DUF533 family)